MPDETVKIELAKDEALVLFEWLYKQSNADSPIAIDPVEQFALDRLFGKFEKGLAEPFKPDYTNILKDARKQLSERAGI
ncbi:MAG: hypothetical protein JF609_01425 [Verrucomicrobia bacterium]|nr:hypothetical protein [Verrucomicrobiota bacterium]